jgi:hypothetical protein
VPCARQQRGRGSDGIPRRAHAGEGVPAAADPEVARAVGGAAVPDPELVGDPVEDLAGGVGGDGERDRQCEELHGLVSCGGCGHHHRPSPPNVDGTRDGR